MLVGTVDCWIVPAVVLVATEPAMTLPDVCSPAAAALTSASKLVSVSLKPVVCELAMLPEMFCSANDCACRPPTAVVRASKRPMAGLQLAFRRRPRSHVAATPKALGWCVTTSGEKHRNPRAKEVNLENQ